MARKRPVAMLVALNLVAWTAALALIGAGLMAAVAVRVARIAAQRIAAPSARSRHRAFGDGRRVHQPV